MILNCCSFDSLRPHTVEEALFVGERPAPKIYYLLIPAGEGLQRQESTSTCSKWHQNSCKAIEQGCVRGCNCCRPHCVASFDGNCNYKSSCPPLVPACSGCFYVWKHLQDNFWSYHICLCDASIWCWWPLSRWWCPGNSHKTCLIWYCWGYFLIISSVWHIVSWQLIVDEMNILTTVFLKIDREKVYYPNSVLATKPISNFYRSSPMGDNVEFSIAFATTAEKIGALKERIAK